MAQRFRSTAADEDNGANLDGTTTYAYDDINRLTEAIYPGNQATSHRRVTYAYNDSGDRTSLMRWTGSPGSWSQDGSTVSSTYDSAGRLTAAGGVNYCHDANGNQTRRAGSTCSTGGDTFGWDTHNRFLNYNPSGGSTTTYAYNGDGVRVKKTVGSAATYYFQDVAGDLPRVAAELPTTSNVWTFYVYGLKLIGQVGDDGVGRYYHYDGNGTVRAITDAAGAVVERYDYDAFGALRNTPSGATNDRRYTGEQHDAESGYTFLRARYYDPALGRFISKDPFPGVQQDPQTLNGYIYVGNNPLVRTDPSGKCWIFCIGLVFSAVYGAVEFIISSYDAYSTVEVLSNPNASWQEKAAASAGFAAGLALPGGGYGTGARAIVNKFHRFNVNNAQLADALSHLYRPNDKDVGGTAGALINEALTWQQTGGRWHWEKAQGRSKQLTSLIQSGQLDANDMAIARAELENLDIALKVWDSLGSIKRP
ncbi:MAG: hypothetical protein NTZ05_15490 [Chloroflexi bacterium]|nr:hypothetical protein [Chloroflexota bacterium]